MWKSNVQARQKATHKRTFYFLEQLILKHKMNDDTLKVQDQPDGLDFYYSHRSQAMKMIDFFQSVAPIRYDQSKELVTQDSVNMTYDYKYTFSLEICPICKDDLVCLPPKVSAFFGGCAPLLVCSKITANVNFIDPLTLKTYELNSSQYWRYNFSPIASAQRMVEFTVIDSELVGPEHKKWALADVDVQKTSELGVGEIMTVRSHLGRVLQPGDSVLGYDMTTLSFNPLDVTGMKNKEFPYAVLIRKHYPDRKKKKRAWKLKNMDMEVAEEAQTKSGAKKDAEIAEKKEEDYERFLQELEEDKDMRGQIDMYHDPEYKPVMEVDDVMDDDDEAPPEVGLEELLDGMKIEEGEEI